MRAQYGRGVAGLLAVVVVGVVIGAVLGAVMLFTIAVCLRKRVDHAHTCRPVFKMLPVPSYELRCAAQLIVRI